MTSNDPVESPLSCCHGYAVAAAGRQLGLVETPVFAGSALDPESLMVRTTEGAPGTFRLVSVDCVLAIDISTQVVTLRPTWSDEGHSAEQRVGSAET